MNIRVPGKKLISELTLAEKQMVLIARAVSKQCRILVLDEPTAPLSHSETDQLFAGAQAEAGWGRHYFHLAPPAGAV